MSEKVNWDDFTPVEKAAPVAKTKEVDWSQFEPAKPVGALRKLGDLGAGFASGAIGATKSVADAAGAGNSVSGALDTADKFTQGLLSPQAKADQQEQQGIMKEASGKGVLDQIGVAGRAFAVAPVQTTVQGLGSIVPTIAAGLATGGASVPVSLGAMAAMGAAQGAGAVKGGIYDDIKQRSAEAGMDPATAEARALSAQEYGGPNTAQIALGGALGTADAATGVSKVATSMIRRGMNREAAQLVEGSSKGILARTALGAAGEVPLEAAQGGQQQYATNAASNREGFDVNPWDGVVAQGAFEGLASAGPGAAFGAANRGGQAPAALPATEVAPAPADPLGLPPPSITVDSSGQAMTTDQRQSLRDTSGATDVIPRAVAPAPTAAQAMGIDETAGPLSKGASIAVNSGLTDALAAQAETAAASMQSAGKPLPEATQDRSLANSAVTAELETQDAIENVAQEPQRTGAFATEDEARGYISDQKRAGGMRIQALPLPQPDGSFGVAIAGSPDYTVAEFHQKQSQLRAAGVLDGDTLTKAGGIFPNRMGASNAARKAGAGFETVPVTGGFVVRKTEAPNGASAEVQSLPAGTAGRGLPDSAPSLAAGVGTGPTAAPAVDAGRSADKPAGSTVPRSAAAPDAVTPAAAVYQKALAKIQAEYENDPNAIRRAAAINKAKKAFDAATIAEQKPSVAPYARASTAIENVAKPPPLEPASVQKATPSQAKPATQTAPVEAPAPGSEPESNRVTAGPVPGTAGVEAAGVAGKKIDKDWSTFAPESGTKGIPRADMPQIKAEHRGAMVNFLAARGITSEQADVPADSLKPTQAEFSPEKVKKAKAFEGGDRSILVSSDGHVLDGHHQWMARREGNETVKVIRLNAPIDQLIGAVKEFPSAQTSEGATVDTKAAVAKLIDQQQEQPSAQTPQAIEATPQRPEPPATSEVKPRPATWRTNMIAASKVARDMGIKPKGMKLAEVVSAIDAADGTPQASASPAKDAPVQLGRNNTPMSEGGKPFKTKLAATTAKKLQPVMRVVRVEGGYALAEKTPAQLAAEVKAARRLRNPQTSPAGEAIPAHAMIAAEGGLAPAERADMGMEGNVSIGNRKLFAGIGKGLTIERATEKLIEDGYLPDDASHQQARDLIKRSLNNPQYTPEGTERMAEKEAIQREADYNAEQEAIALAQEAEDNALADAADAYEVAVLELPESQRQEDMDFDAALLAAGYTQQEIEDDQAIAVDTSPAQAVAATDQSPVEAAARPGAQSDSGRESAPGAVQGQDASLVAPSRDDILAQQARKAAAEKAEAKAKADADKKEKADREAADIKAAGATAADRFVLGGNAEDELSGQGGMFDAPAAEYGYTSQNGRFSDSTQPDDGREPAAAGTVANDGLRGSGGAVQRRARITGLGIAADIKRAGSVALVGREVTNAGDLAELAQIYRDPRYETFRVFFTKGDTIAHSTGVSARLPGQTPLMPAGMSQTEYVAMLKAELARTGADGYYILHNHPSGNPTPSTSDVSVTEYLALAVPGMRAHVVINSGKYAVITPGTGVMVASKTQVITNDFGEDRLMQASKPMAALGRRIGGPEDLAMVGKSMQKPGWITFIGLDSGGKVRMVAEAPSRTLTRSTIYLAGMVRRLQRQSGAATMFVVGDNADVNSTPVKQAVLKGILKDALPDVGMSLATTLGQGADSPFNLTAGRFLAEPAVKIAKPAMLQAAPMNAAAFEKAFAPAAPMTVEAAQAVVDRVTAKWTNGPRILVVNATADLPDQVRARVSQKSRGVYTRDAVYIIAPNNRSADQVAQTLAHEAIAHHGLRGLLGPLGHLQLMKQVDAGIARGDPALVASSKYVDDAYKNANLSAKDRADEVAAHVVEMAVNPVTGEFKPGYGFLKMTFARIAAFLRRIGIDVPFTVSELHGMLVASMRNLETGRRTYGGGVGVVAAARDGDALSAASRGTNAPVTNSKDVVGKTQGGRSADDTAPGAANKAVDSKGKPVAVYHGTPRVFDKFEATHISSGMYGEGFYFTTLKEDAELYAEGGRVISATVTITNPASREVAETVAERIGEDEYTAIRQELQRMGYDGVIAKGFTAGETTYVAFTSGQINLNEPTASNSDDATLQAAGTDQTDTPAFKKWFGDSKVVDANGTPLVVYHGTSSNFDTFEKAQSGRNWRQGNDAFFFTSRQRSASNYAERGGDGANVLPVYLNLRNPYILEALDPIDFYDLNVSPELQPLIAQGHDGVVIRSREGGGDLYVAVNPEQIKSAIGNNGNFDGTDPDILMATEAPDRATAIGDAIKQQGGNPHSWDSLEESRFDDLVYKLQDKQIDTKRVVDSIKATSGALSDEKNVYLQEELFHGRAASRTEDFVNKELGPLVNMMKMRNIDIPMLDEYLHARHAEEANKLIAERNPEILDGGSGMTTQAARDYLAKLTPAERNRLDAVAAKVDGILANTRQLYADYDLESQEKVDGWGTMFKHYVPLMREDKDGGMGIGQGFSIKGKEVKGRTGSTRKVVDILANIALQRERAIVRGEKNRVATALVGLVNLNPNKAFWNVGPPPATKVYDPASNSVVERQDPLYKSRDNVVMAKVKGKDGVVTEQAVTFNEDDPRALRMAMSLKNLDAAQLEGLLGVSAKITRYFAAINTQYNPIFGTANLVRDVQGALFNLTSTPLKGKALAIAGHTLSALKGIYMDARATRDGKVPTSQWAALWDDFQAEGGQTGFRDLFANSADRAKAIERELNPTAWMDSPLGKVFTADGKLKVPLAVAQKKATGMFDWLSDYNLAMENAVRLAAYKVALEQGISKQQSASLGKNLTVNFNRKGQVGQQAGALYAFFNASMQGTARLGETLFDMEPGKPKTIRMSATGKKIIYGGILLGSMQALLLAGAGFDDEEPPDFVRERSLIIPTGGKTYITIPMPLGLHVLPNMGRIPMEFAMGGFKDPVQTVSKLIGLFANSFNPIGGGASLVQMLAPTAIDPLVAIAENKDWTGKPIAKTAYNKATPGHLLAKDTATAPAKMLSEAINFMSGGTAYTAGVLSPTPDQIDYLFGQVTGGVGREVSKLQQSGSAMVSGEDLPIHKVPLVGRFYGDTDTQSAQSGKFYSAINKINVHEAEIKGLRKDGKGAEATQYIQENPEARLFMAANMAEREVQNLRAAKRALIAKDAPADEVKAMETRINERMTRFNLTMQRLREKEAA